MVKFQKNMNMEKKVKSTKKTISRRSRKLFALF
jgi:hypothetical protein